MDYLFSSDNVRILESFLLAETFFAFDYDGTLAPIVPDPRMARLRKVTEDLFQKLCSLKSVGIITGRSSADLKELLHVHPKYIVGNHGADIESEEFKTSSKRAMGELKDELLRKFQEQHLTDVVLEDKELSLSLHYRNASDQEFTYESLMNILFTLPIQFKTIPGKSVINIVMARSPDKFSALLSLMEKEQCRFAIYVGDDDTDEAVFVNRSARILTIRIGHSETSRAKYYLRNQNEMDVLLSMIVNDLNSRQNRSFT